MSKKTNGKKKWKNNLSSESESDDDMTFTKIKKIYKCGICNKKIKNYCKCTMVSNSNVPAHSGANIITIMTNPDNDKIPIQNQKGEKGDRGLTGSMGLPGNSFIFFTSSEQIKSGDFIGINTTNTEFNKPSIAVPYEFYIKQIGFVVKNQIDGKCSITLYVNNKPTDYVVCICENTSLNNNNAVGFKTFNSIVKIKPTDLFCFKISYDCGTLSNGVCITMVIN